MARVHCELHLCKTMEVAVADFWSVATTRIQIQGFKGRVADECWSNKSAVCLQLRLIVYKSQLFVHKDQVYVDI